VGLHRRGRRNAERACTCALDGHGAVSITFVVPGRSVMAGGTPGKELAQIDRRRPFSAVRGAPRLKAGLEGTVRRRKRGRREETRRGRALVCRVRRGGATDFRLLVRATAG
jgi:hypothetical protein